MAERSIDPRLLELPEVFPVGYDPALDEVRVHDGVPSKVDRLGNPITLREWTRAYESMPLKGSWRGSYRDVAYDEGGSNENGGPEWSVWTSWTGFGHNGPFETSIFRERGEKVGEDFDHLDQVRSGSEEDALKAHANAVARAAELVGV